MDSILLFPPGPSVAGSQLQLGTYLMWDPGADYGAKGLVNSIESSNALRDGGVFAYRSVGPRQMSFPLHLRDVPGQTFLQTESLLREWTTAGARVAVQPETVPSGQAVFFDVIDGRWEPDYDGFMNRAGIRRGTLFLDTQPWGYWPTEILLASAASQGFMGQLAINSGASVIGDIPPLVRVQIQPTQASGYLPTQFGAQSLTDMVALSFGGRPSFVPFIPAGQFVVPTTITGISFSGTSAGGGKPTLVGDAFAPGSQAIAVTATAAGAGGNPGGPFLIAYSGSGIPSALEPAYRGRFRVFSFMKINAAGGVPTNTFTVTIDAERSALTASGFSALASGNQLATLGYATSPLNIFTTPTLPYQILDQGELTLPPGGGSGMQGGIRFRYWLSGTTAAAYGATVSFAGIYLLPLDGAAGILTRGAVVPSLNGNTQGGVEWNSNLSNETVGIVTNAGLRSVGAQPAQVQDAKAFYRGVAPRVGASTSQLTFLTADRSNSINYAITQQQWQGGVDFSKVSVSYQPRFQFLAGL